MDPQAADVPVITMSTASATAINSIIIIISRSSSCCYRGGAATVTTTKIITRSNVSTHKQSCTSQRRVQMIFSSARRAYIAYNWSNSKSGLSMCVWVCLSKLGRWFKIQPLHITWRLIFVHGDTDTHPGHSLKSFPENSHKQPLAILPRTPPPPENSPNAS